MLFNKNQLNKLNNNQILKKISKNWKTISIATLMTLGGIGAMTTYANANSTNNSFSNSPVNVYPRDSSLQVNNSSSASARLISNNKINLDTNKIYQNVLQHGITNSSVGSTSNTSFNDSRATSLSYSTNYSEIYNDYYDASYDMTAGQKATKKLSNVNIQKSLNTIQSAASGIYNDFSINNKSAVSNASVKASLANQALSLADQAINNVTNSLSYSAAYNSMYSKNHNLIHSDAYDAAYAMSIANNTLTDLTTSTAHSNPLLANVSEREIPLFNQMYNVTSYAGTTSMLNEHQSMAELLKDETNLNNSMTNVINNIASAHEYQNNPTARNLFSEQSNINHNETTIINAEKQINHAHMHPTTSMASFANSKEKIANSARDTIYSLSTSAMSSSNYSSIYNAYYNASCASNTTKSLLNNINVANNASLSTNAVKDKSTENYAMSAISHDFSINSIPAVINANNEEKIIHNIWTNTNDVIYNARKPIYHINYVSNNSTIFHRTVHSLEKAIQFVPFGYSFHKIVNSSVINGNHILTISITPRF